MQRVCGGRRAALGHSVLVLPATAARLACAVAAAGRLPARLALARADRVALGLVVRTGLGAST
eukprot:12800816-Alexandrium_andersonii.AAC.1